MDPLIVRLNSERTLSYDLARKHQFIHHLESQLSNLNQSVIEEKKTLSQFESIKIDLSNKLKSSEGGGEGVDVSEVDKALKDKLKKLNFIANEKFKGLSEFIDKYYTNKNKQMVRIFCRSKVKS